MISHAIGFADDYDYLYILIPHKVGRYYYDILILRKAGGYCDEILISDNVGGYYDALLIPVNDEGYCNEDTDTQQGWRILLWWHWYRQGWRMIILMCLSIHLPVQVLLALCMEIVWSYIDQYEFGYIIDNRNADYSPLVINPYKVI